MEELESVVIRNIILKSNIIYIPTKVEAKMKYISEEDMLKVHNKLEISKELILLFLSMFSDTYVKSTYMPKTESEKEGYKTLYSKILSDKFKIGKKSTYKSIIDLLIKNKILEKGRNYSKGLRSNEYKLTKTYFGKGILPYEVKTKIVRNKIINHVEANLQKVLQCSIAKNELLFRDMLNFPTQEEAKQHLIKISKEGRKTRKERILFT